MSLGRGAHTLIFHFRRIVGHLKRTPPITVTWDRHRIGIHDGRKARAERCAAVRAPGGTAARGRNSARVLSMLIEIIKGPRLNACSSTHVILP